MNLTEEQINQAINTLQRNFGANNLNRDVLVSVLEICNGDPQLAIQFLQAQEGDIIENNNNNQNNQNNNNNNERLPRGYMDKPQNWRPLNELEEKLKEMRLKENKEEGKNEELRLEINELKKLFMTEDAKPFQDHLEGFSTKKHKYISLLIILIEQGVEISLNVKSKLLATLMHFKEWNITEYLWNLPQYAFGLPEILRACKYLDSPRKIKNIQKKINLLQQNKSKASIINKYQLQLSDCREFFFEEQKTSLTSSVIKRIKKWVKKIPERDLQFWALHMPYEPWKELSDLIHLSPSDFKVDWYLPVMFGKAPPETSLAVVGKKIHGGNVKELCEKFKVPYSFIRKQIKNLSMDVKKTVASYENIDVVLWYYEELECPSVNEIIKERLVKEKPNNFTYGKLMERILTFKLSNAPFVNHLIPLAEQKLHQVKIPLDRPVVVLGDSSYSMDVAIRVSTIISSLLSVLAGAKLLFFNDKIVKPHLIPKTIEQVIDVATNTKADGLTASACCLWDFYQTKKIVKFFVLVTDEIENEQFQGHFFAQLFYKYYVEVFPAKLVFVSFLENPNEKGRMIRSLESLGIQILQFRLSASRPDLSKLDTLLGLISSETLHFPLQVKSLTETSEETNCNLEKMLEKFYNNLSSTENEMLEIENSKEDLNKNDQPNNNDLPIKQGGDIEYKLDEFDKIPEDFICPIGLTLMKDPVVASDGHSYERETINSWLLKSKTSPITGEVLETTTVFPNFKLKGQIQNWLSNQKK